MKCTPSGRTALRDIHPERVLGDVLGRETLLGAHWQGIPRQATVRRVAGGTLLWREGETPEDLTIVVEGMVKVHRRLPTGESVGLGMFGPKEAVGLIAALDGQPYPADAEVLSRYLVMVRIPLRVVRPAFEQDANAMRRLMLQHTRTSRRLLQRVMIGGPAQVDARIACLLICLAERYGNVDDDGVVSMQMELTRRTIGEFVGARVETVIRTMSRWSSEGLLETTGGQMRILQPRVMESLATLK